MNNKKITQYKGALPLVFQDSNISKEIIKPSDNTLRKVKGFPSATSVWSNSVYSFNKNYLKNIPAVDNIVNKIIKSFFTINPLATNPNGKKSRLVQRRYKRLSLNKILVSKSEIKHTSDKVFITVYLFNKKKRSLLLKLKNLYSSLSLNKFYSVSRPNPLNVNFKSNSTSKEERSDLTKLNKKQARLSQDTINNNKYNAWNKYSNKLNVLETNSTGNNNKSKSINLKLNYAISSNSNKMRALNKAFFNKYGFIGLISKKSKLNNNKSLFMNEVFYYKNLNNLTKSNIHSFVASLGSGFNSNLDTNTLNLNSIFKHINKYKLYNEESNINSTVWGKPITSAVQISNKKVIPSNYSIYKLKSMYKLFALYNNINYINNNNNVSDIYSKKILLSTYKLLKKSSIKFPFSTLYESKNINSLNEGGTRLIKNNKSYSNLNKSIRNGVLINKLNRIDRFINKYKDILTGQISSNNTNSNLEMSLKTQIINNYKINFINDLLEKELLYIYYLKLLSYNNAIFKNWFLYSLKNLISKIYNKKVVFNLVNLKYMHLNSDILSQAVNIRLRNFKKNRVVKVLKKVIKIVPISKVNIYACDEHSSIYKYVQNYHSKFKNLKLDVFKEIGLFTNKKDSNGISSFDVNANNNVIPTTKIAKIRRLNHIQSSTINFIKYKSVFGVRLEAAGRLTKRSTASRSIFKFRYNGTLRNNPIINNSLSSVIVKNNRISNLQFTKIASKTRNGSFGLKGWINNN